MDITGDIGVTVKSDLIKDGECIDDLQRAGLYIIQKEKGFKFGMDAVLLSGYANIHKNEDVIDLCSGNGIVPLLLYAKTNAGRICGIEIQKEIAEMAQRSVEYNKLTDKIEIVCGDVKEATEKFGKASFDVVTVNPPYMKADAGLKNPNDFKAIARHEVMLSLDELVKSTSELLVPNGRVYMIHRPFRLTEIIENFHKYGIEIKKMRMVYPFIDKEPNMVLLEGIKGAKPYLVNEKPLIVYKEKDKYTEEILETYGY